MTVTLFYERQRIAFVAVAEFATGHAGKSNCIIVNDKRVLATVCRVIGNEIHHVGYGDKGCIHSFGSERLQHPLKLYCMI